MHVLPPGVAEPGSGLQKLGWVTELFVGGSAATDDYVPAVSDLDCVALVAGTLDAARQMTLARVNAATRLADHPLEFQGHVISAGNFLATWAVELTVHHVDLGRDLDVGEPTMTAMRLTRDTIGALLRTPVPSNISDLEALLIGSGRAPVPEGENGLRAVLG